MKYLLPLLCLLLLGCGSGQSADTSGDYLAEASPVRWQSRSITYWIEPHDSNLPGIDPPRTVERGLRSWQEPLEGRLTLTRTSDRNAANIAIRFGTRDEVGTRQDFVILSYDNSGQYLRRAEAVIYRGLTPWQMDAAARHSMGHALGIRGHSKIAPDVMFHYPHGFKPLSRRDKATIQGMYP
jgi:hypothetical protein